MNLRIVSTILKLQWRTGAAHSATSKKHRRPAKYVGWRSAGGRFASLPVEKEMAEQQISVVKRDVKCRCMYIYINLSVDSCGYGIIMCWPNQINSGTGGS